MDLGQQYNQSSTLMNNSSFNLIFGNPEDKARKSSSMMLESADKRSYNYRKICNPQFGASGEPVRGFTQESQQL